MRVKKGKEITLKEVLLNHLGVNDTDEINGWFKKSYANEYRIDGFDKAKEMDVKTIRKISTHQQLVISTLIQSTQLYI